MRAIQDTSATPFAHWGVDTPFAAVPPNWGGGRDGPLSRDGFRYDRTGRDAGGRPVVVIRCGEVGRRMLRSACAAAAAFARGGDDLVVDEILLTPGLIRDWTTALTGLDVLFVRVTCPLAVAEQRERARDHAVVGLARGHLPTVHEGRPVRPGGRHRVGDARRTGRGRVARTGPRAPVAPGHPTGGGDCSAGGLQARPRRQ